MWEVYFNSWVLESGEATDDMPAGTIVPLTRELQEEEVQMLVKYFHQPGMKTLPPGLPYVEGGKVFSISAPAGAELEKVAADKDLELVAFMVVKSKTVEDSDEPTKMQSLVQRMKLTGKADLENICGRAYQKVAESTALWKKTFSMSLLKFQSSGATQCYC